MAEEFVIRVQVEQLQGRSAAPRTGPNAQQNTGTGLGDSALAEVEQRGRIQTYRPINFADYSYDERYTKRGVGQAGRIGTSGVSDLQDYEFRNLGLQKFGTVRQAQLVDPNMVGPPTAPFTQETMFGAGVRQTGKFLQENRARVRASLTIAVNSGLRASIAIKNHRSGDSFRNEQRQLAASAGSSLASIGIATAI